MLRRVTEDYIVNVLKNHDQIVLNCQIELLNIFKDKDEVGMIESASMSRKEPDGSAPTNSLTDLQNVLEQYFRLSEEWRMSIYANVRTLIETQETVYRIMACFNNLEQEQRYVLEQLYIKHTFKEGIQILMKELDRSRTSILNFRKNAIENVKSMYDSNQSNLELYGLTLKNGQNKYR
ncbi:MAG: hypothetical protein ACLRU5_06350 [Lachnospira eligens]